MNDAIFAPEFDRITNYAGLWAIEPVAFAGLWMAAKEMDFARHFAQVGKQRLAASRVEMRANSDGRSVAVIPITGVMMKASSSMGGTSTVRTRQDIRAAANDPNVSAILLAIDSPGGTVAGTADLGAEVKAARSKKPVWAHIDDLGASAAYWVASQADAIYANAKTALIGSIGTLQTVYDLSAAAEKEGVKVHVFKTGPMKGVGVPGAPVTEEQQTELQRLVNETQTHFDAAVRTGRSMSAAQLADVRTGGVFPASEAVEKRLIDGIRSYERTLAALSAAK